MGNERSKLGGEGGRATQLIGTLDPSGGFTPEQTLQLWRIYDTTGEGKLLKPDALRFFKSIVSRMKALGQVTMPA